MFTRTVLASRYPNSVDQFLNVQRALRSLDETWNNMGSCSATSGAVKSSGLPVRLDVKENEHALFVSADLPGLSEKEVEVSFNDGLLTLSGEKKVTRDEKGETWHVVERSSGSFSRKLSVTTPIDAAKIEAKFINGVLTVTLPKLPEAQPNAHKIEIKTS